MDYFCKFTFLKPLREASAKAVVRHIENDIFLVYRAPRSIFVDNGPQYRSKEFKNMCEKYNVKIRYNIAYNPRGNPTERTNQTVETMIACFVERNHKKWDLLIPELQYAIRSSVNLATRFTQNLLVFGKEINLDGRTHLLNDEDLEIPEVNSRAEYVEAQQNHSALYEMVKETMLASQQRNSLHYNLRRRPVDYPVGQAVWKKKFVLSNAAKHFCAKLAPKWIGPFKIKAKVGRVSYLLEDETGNEIGPCHVDQLKSHFKG